MKDKRSWFYGDDPKTLKADKRLRVDSLPSKLMSVKAAGVKEISLHGLRHTFASHYIMNGGTKSELKEVLGHSSELVTEIYSHISAEHLRSRINVVGFGRNTREFRGIK